MPLNSRHLLVSIVPLNSLAGLFGLKQDHPDDDFGIFHCHSRQVALEPAVIELDGDGSFLPVVGDAVRLMDGRCFYWACSASLGSDSGDAGLDGADVGGAVGDSDEPDDYLDCWLAMALFDLLLDYSLRWAALDIERLKLDCADVVDDDGFYSLDR